MGFPKLAIPTSNRFDGEEEEAGKFQATIGPKGVEGGRMLPGGCKPSRSHDGRRCIRESGADVIAIPGPEASVETGQRGEERVAVEGERGAGSGKNSRQRRKLENKQDTLKEDSQSPARNKRCREKVKETGERRSNKTQGQGVRNSKKTVENKRERGGRMSRSRNNVYSGGCTRSKEQSEGMLAACHQSQKRIA